MKTLKFYMTAFILISLFTSCQETFDMIPPPEPGEEPEQKTMYMLGSAAPNGWDIANATAITSVPGNANRFMWTGELAAGEIKFSLDKQSDWGGAWYLAAENGAIVTGDEQAVVYCPAGDCGADYKWNVVKAGEYSIDLDADKMTIIFKPNFEPEPEEQAQFDMIYFVGSFSGWSFEPMMQDKTNPLVFKYGREMTWNDGGEFKFATESGNWDNMYHPTIENAPYTHQEIVLGETFGDKKWFLSEEESNKPYKMILDISLGKEKFIMQEFTPYPLIYLVGEASPNGWDINNATPMDAVQDNPYVFTWVGELKTGELKFTCDKQEDWGGAWFLAWQDGLAPDSEEQQLVFSPNGDGGNDRKFKIAEPGTYTIILDQLREVVLISK